MKQPDPSKKAPERKKVQLTRKAVGAMGEQIVEGYLQKRGHVVMARNYRKPWGELDIVSSYKGVLYVSEVKTALVRQAAESVTAYRVEDLLHRTKLKRLFRAAMSFLLEKGIEDTVPLRLDGYIVTFRASPDGVLVGGKIKRIPDLWGSA